MQSSQNYVDGSRWTSNTLQRTSDQARNTLIKTRLRSFRYPEAKPVQQTPIYDPTVYSSLDDAFSSVMTTLSTCSRQCLRFYRSTPHSQRNTQDQRFCQKYLHPKYTEIQRKNPLDRTESMNVIVAPGTYSITAGTHGEGSTQQTHIVHVGRGETAAVDFHL